MKVTTKVIRFVGRENQYLFKTRKYLIMINAVVATANEIDRPDPSCDADSQEIKLLRNQLVEEIPASLARILAASNDTQLCILTATDKTGPITEEIRRAARIRLERIEASDRARLCSLAEARMLGLSQA